MSEEHINLYKILSIRIKANLDTSSKLSASICHSVFHKMNHFIFDDYNKIAGYIIWASVCEESIYRLEKFNVPLKYFHEWNDGNKTLILDIVTPLKITRKKIIDFMGNYDEVFFFRKNKLTKYRVQKNKLIISHKNLDMQ